MAASAAAAAAGRTSSAGHLQHYGHDPRRMVASGHTSRGGGNRTRSGGGQGVQGQYRRGPADGNASRTRSSTTPAQPAGQRAAGLPPPPPPVHATSARGYSHRYVTGVDYYSEDDAPGCCCLSSLCRHCDFIQVIAFICGLIVVLLMILCLASSNWLTAEKFRQGLWEQCIDDKAPQPLPFDLEQKGGGCYPVRPVGYIQAAAVLCVLTLLCDIGATVMTGCGLCSKDPQRKYLLYRIALYVMVCALLCILVALVIYPACFAAEIEKSNRQLWEFGWAYGVGWGAAIFLFGAILLLLCDKETEEIYYKERAITHHHGNESKA